MPKINKTLFPVIIISLVVGALAGATAGVFAIEYAYGDLNGKFANMLPYTIRQNIIQEAESHPTIVQDPGRSEESIVVSAVEKVAPAVVSIVASKEVAITSRRITLPEEFFFGTPFQIETPEKKETQKKDIGSGTGFIVASDGMIVTNKHVAAYNDADYSVIMADGKKYKAEVIARDPFYDLAILKIEGKDFPVAKLGNSDNIRIGETVIAIGNALSEFSNTITKGVVSGINRRVVAGGSALGTEVIEEAIQTDAAINPGNSGGPLVNLRGEVIGVNTATSQAGQSIGFSIPINNAKGAIDSVKETGKISRPWIGVRYTIIDQDSAKENNLSVDYGAILVSGEDSSDPAISPGSPADVAGLKENDIILEIDGMKVTQEDSLARQIQKHKVGEKVSLKILSQGEEKTVEVILGEFPQ